MQLRKNVGSGFSLEMYMLTFLYWKTDQVTLGPVRVGPHGFCVTLNKIANES